MRGHCEKKHTLLSVAAIEGYGQAMGQIFHPAMNTVAKATIFGAVFIVAAAGWIGWEVDRSPYVTGAGVPRAQPVPFSHEHHVSGLGIECRYCHTSVTESAVFGIRATKTC